MVKMRPNTEGIKESAFFFLLDVVSFTVCVCVCVCVCS
ncbi:hypothetical protein E2C01_037753 [Portunus trituberculatus]|uniref:Uncharacterized protein n=1 Tax=Portunus trituberculatus TaxID=210409 RepID=A0A5B7FFS9_PORTR|nr:hypothetical protein [Portunus trituberculatus]